MDRIACATWEEQLEFYDAELRAYHEHLRIAHRINPGDDVLDIGCGTGLTTREAARAAAPGHVVGVDISEHMIESALQATVAERLDNVLYQLGDVQTHQFAPASFDVGISRFGTMFFADPAAAFTNIAAALRPGGRLVLLVWQRREDNEWAQAIDGALADAVQPPSPGANPFSLGDAEATKRLLEHAGFGGLCAEDVREPVFYGRDIDDALKTVLGFRDTSAALATLNGVGVDRAVERLRKALRAHFRTEEGVVFDSRSWLITARRSHRH